MSFLSPNCRGTRTWPWPGWSRMFSPMATVEEPEAVV